MAQQQAAAQAQAQAQAAAQAQAQQAAEYAAAQAQAQQAAEYAAWQAQQEQAMQQAYYTAAPASSGRAIGSLICGILAILCFAVPGVGLILAIVAIVLALRSNKVFGKTGTSKGGLVTGIVGGVLSLVTVAATVFLAITLMQAADEGTFGINLDAIFTPAASSGRSNGATPMSDGGFDYSDYLNAGEQQAYDVVNERLNSLKSGDAQTLQEVATAADQSFQQTYGASMQSCGIDPNTYVKSMIENFTYDIDTVVVADTADGRSYVTAALSCRDVADVKSSFDEVLNALNAGTNLASVTSDEVKAQISQAFISAVDNARFASGSTFTVDVTQSGESWAIDPASWNQQIIQFFGFA